MHENAAATYEMSNNNDFYANMNWCELILISQSCITTRWYQVCFQQA